MRNSFSGHRRILLAILVIVSFLEVSTAMGQADEQDQTHERDRITLRMVQLAEAGKIRDARETLREYLQDFPSDGTMLYNLACFDLLLQEKDQAFADLESALANGYTNFRLIDTDRSLNPLRDDPLFTALVLDYELRFREDFNARALYLDEGYSSDPIPLDGDDDASSTQAVTRLSFDRDALHVRVEVVDSDYEDSKPLWLGGNGVLINLVRPMSPDDYESKRFHSLGVGVVDGQATATLIAHDGDVLLKPLADLKPIIQRTETGLVYEIAIGWDYFRPYAPPLDQDMGLNIFYLGSGRNADRPILSLMPESRLSYEADPWRRYVPVSFYTSDLSEPVLRGRLYDRLVESGTVDVQLAIWSHGAGPGYVRSVITNADGTSIESSEPNIDEIDWEDGLNFFNIPMDVESLPEGLYNLSVSAKGPDGITLNDRFEFSRFSHDWLESLNRRIHALDTPEKTILKYHTFVLTREVNSRHTQNGTAHLHATLQRLREMTENCEQGGSCLPDQGLFLGGFATDTMTQRLCAMYLPQGYRELDDPRIMIVVPPAPGMETTLASLLGEALQGCSDAIVLVPQSHGFSGLKTALATEHTRLVAVWALELFGGKTITLVGLGSGADAALGFSLDNPDLCRRVLLDTDQLLSEKTLFTSESFRTVLMNRHNDVPYTFASRHLAPERKELIISVMTELGFDFETYCVDNEAEGRERLIAWLRNCD